jgi:hypothetical protein
MGLRLWLGLGFVLAAAATVVAALSVNVAWLRLAVLLGIWAALIAAIALTWSRRDVRSSELRIEESKLTYQLELQREISARREFEMAVSQTAREEAENLHREELTGLREQLDRLNSTLSGLLDGDLLFERLTLSAESTRVRQVGDGGRGRFAGMVRPVQLEAPSEVVEPVWPTNDAESKEVFVSPPAAVRGDASEKAVVASHPEQEDDTIQFPRNMFGPEKEAEPTGIADSVPGQMNGASPSVPAHDSASIAPAAEPDAEVAEVESEPDAEVAEVESEPDAEVAEPEPEPHADSLETAGTPQTDVPKPTSELGDGDSGPIDLPAERQDGITTSAAEPQFDTAAVQDEGDAGHSAGISVADLLAAYGATEGAPRRRRRAED